MKRVGETTLADPEGATAPVTFAAFDSYVVERRRPPRRHESQEILVGGQLGTSLFTFQGEGVDGLDRYRTGLAWGVTVAYPLGRWLRLEGGAWWVDKGAAGELQRGV